MKSFQHALGAKLRDFFTSKRLAEWARSVLNGHEMSGHEMSVGTKCPVFLCGTVTGEMAYITIRTKLLKTFPVKRFFSQSKVLYLCTLKLILSSGLSFSGISEARCAYKAGFYKKRKVCLPAFL